jgi:AdoMet-dependent heme synthase
VVGALIARLAPESWNVRVAVEQERAPRPEQYEAVLHHLCDWVTETGLAVEATAAPALRRVAFERASALSPAERRRLDRTLTALPAPNDGKGIIFVSHSGDVCPSDLLPLSAGNLRRASLVELYRTAPLFREIRSYWRLEGKCGACPFYVPCGGSRARAHAASGHVLGADPSCGYRPPGYADD